VQKDARELVEYRESIGTSAALNEQTIASFLLKGTKIII